MSYLIVFAVVELLVIVHEWGHFAAARRMGLPVARFSVGFGPKLWGFRRGGTEYWISAVPLGGYVLLDLSDEESWFRIPLLKRILFAFSGPATNLLLPIPLFALLNALSGRFSLLAPFAQTWEMLRRVVESIPLLFQRPDMLSGVVGIVHQGGQYVHLSAARAVFLAILVSLNLGLFNLLPIPALDGGKIVLDIAHRLNPRLIRFMRPAAAVALVLLLSLFVCATVQDVRRILG